MALDLQGVRVMDHGSLVFYLGSSFMVFAMLAFSSYMRIIVILQAFDSGLENPPRRPHLQDRLRAYRDWCRDRHRKPVLLILFGIGIFGAVLSWTPITWLVFR